MTNTSILTLESVSLALPDGRLLFSELNESFDQRRTGLVGRNGVGKSLLGHILAGLHAPTSGRCRRIARVHHLDQQSIHRSATVAELAQIAPIVHALERIEAGSTAPNDFDLVADRWDVRERFRALLDRQGFASVDLQQAPATLSGGQAMGIALLGAWASDADFLILDEPSNHLDRCARANLLEMIQAWDKGLLVISHDRTLLASMERIVELSSLGLQAFGGDYAFYAEQKMHAHARAEQALARAKQKQQRQARELQRQHENLVRHQAQVEHQAKHANQAKILIDRQQQRSQVSAGKQRRDQKATHQALHEQVREAARQVERHTAITLHAPTPARHRGRGVLRFEALCLPRGTATPLSLSLSLGERLGLLGANGSGKSTLLRLLAGELQATAGTLQISGDVVLLDQHCSQLTPGLSLLEHLRQGNAALSQAQMRTRLAQLGLDAARIELPSTLLSGGERIKGAMAAVLYREQPVDLLLLDEPTNHLDLPSLQALETMLEQFSGALLVASHDSVFLECLHLDGCLDLG